MINIMKAIVVNPDKSLTLGEIERPVPGSKQLLIEVKAAALNRADLMQRDGKYPPPPGASPILGLEIAGVIEEIGNEVTKWQCGNEVFGLVPGGGYAEYAILNEAMALPIPHNLNFIEASAIPEVFLTAYQAVVYYGKIKSGETLLIHAGGSGVGTAAIQLAREIGVRIIVTASLGKHKACLLLGAEYAIDYRAKDFQNEVMAITNSQGVDVIIDFIGAPYLNKNTDCLKVDGKLIMLSSLGGSLVENFDMRKIIGKRLSIIGSALRSRSLDYQIRLVKEFSEFALDKFSSGILKPVVDKVFDWKEAVKAHQYMAENKNTGKIVLRIE
ncbi:MAG: NAD(P)H-quinone oxidoreductase [Ignavibacteriaceae bacterium]